MLKTKKETELVELGNKSLLVVAIQLFFVGILIGLISLADPKPDNHPLTIHILKPEDWHADVPDVEKVLNSAANEIWKHFPDRDLPPIELLVQG